MDRRDFIASVAVSPVAAATAAAAEISSVARTTAARPLSITLLGTGTPAPSLTRQSSGYLIEIGTDLIVWDHGPGGDFAHADAVITGSREGAPRGRQDRGTGGLGVPSARLDALRHE